MQQDHHGEEQTDGDEDHRFPALYERHHGANPPITTTSSTCESRIQKVVELLCLGTLIRWQLPARFLGQLITIRPMFSFRPSTDFIDVVMVVVTVLLDIGV